MSKIRHSNRYTSCACNCTPFVADWNSDGYICYGASNAVVVYNTNDIKRAPEIVTLSGHTKRVNTVKWISSNLTPFTEIISGSTDNTSIIWTKHNDEWNTSARIEGHTDGVNALETLYMEAEERTLLILTSSIDSTIKIWERTSGVVECIQTVSLHSGLCLAIKAFMLPRTQKPVIAFALDDAKIYLFARAQENDAAAEFVKITVLTGHEDWVRCLDVIETDIGNLLLASSSQDTYIRLWNIYAHDELQNKLDTGIHIEQKHFEAYGSKWSTKLEAILSGHEGWVYGLHWHPVIIDETGLKKQPLQLLSASLDKTLIIWEPENLTPNAEVSQGLWIEKVRVGEVGGNGLGFYGGKFGPNGESIMGHGYTGSFHIWKVNYETHKWCPQVVFGGHNGEVTDMRWESENGAYLISVGTDQTTRVHAPWLTPRLQRTTFHELARPQVHGHDMSSLAIISSTQFVSGAEEKVIRVFEAPHYFIENFMNITGSTLRHNSNKNAPEGASVPSLGLSNKAVFTDQSINENGLNNDCEKYFTAICLKEPPTEETLMQNTLWPEIQKLYGHGYEIYALDASKDSSLVASACKASNAEHAAILIWETKSWQQIQTLVSHQLTVTQLAFSPDSKHLLSVSRDRRWSLFHRSDRESYPFDLIAATDKKNGIHSRIIWCCAWSPDCSFFLTGSRDNKVCVWGPTSSTSPDSSLNNYGSISQTLEILNQSVTALAVSPLSLETHSLIAIGSESGLIILYGLQVFSADPWKLYATLDTNLAHHLTVKRLQFRPIPGVPGEQSDDIIQLASCGSDHVIKIHDIQIIK